jgi:hypothetical protein
MADARIPKSRDEEFRGRLRRYEEQMHPRYDLRFDGSELMLQENGHPIMTWPAVSGRPGTGVSVLPRLWPAAAGQLSHQGQ